MQCVTSLPVASTAGGNRTARRNLEHRQEKTRSASRAAGLSVSCWDWLEAVHSNVARVAGAWIQTCELAPAPSKSQVSCEGLEQKP